MLRSALTHVNAKAYSHKFMWLWMAINRLRPVIGLGEGVTVIGGTRPSIGPERTRQITKRGSGNKEGTPLEPLPHSKPCFECLEHTLQS